MKKVFVVLIVAFVVLASVSAFEFKSVGIEVGQGPMVSADMEIVDKFDVYVRTGYYNVFLVSTGAQYEVTSFKLDGTAIALKPGVQLNFNFRDNFFNFRALGTCQFSFKTGKLTAFLRPGLGLDVFSYGKNNTQTEFAWTIEAGVAYLFN